MKTFLVPTDFSETSKNAAKYAARIADQFRDIHLILYNVLDEFATGIDGSPVEDDQHGRRKITELGLQSIKIDLSKITNTPISCVAEESNSFIHALEEYARHNTVDIIIMGIRGSNPLDQILMGNNTLRMVNRGNFPVMIIPPEAVFKGVHNILFTSDFKEVERITPIKPLQKIIQFFNGRLHVVNVDHEHHVELTEEYKSQRAKLEEILEDFNPEFYFIRQYDFIDAINTFVEDKSIDLIITVPKKHSFLKGIFRSSHTKKLAYHSHIPIVAIHE